MTTPLPKQLTEVIDTKFLQEVQDKFAEATGLAVVIADKEGNALTRPSHFTKLCRLIRSTPEGVSRCQKCDAKLGLLANETGKAVMARCHAGLYDQAAPIVVDGEYLGSVLCGQVRFENSLPDWQDALRRYLKKLGVEVPLDGGIFAEIVTTTPDKFRSEAGLLQIMAQYIVSIGLTSVNERRLHEQNLNLMRHKAARLKLEHDLKAMELKALQSQVNPHFLFNTLNTIARLSMLEGAEQAEQVSYALSRLLRYLMRNTGQLATLEDEIAHVEEYLKVQQFCFGERLHCEIRVPPEAKSFRVPIMTLQPLVENALVHGLQPLIGGGIVRITVTRTVQEIGIHVEDNGIGMPPQSLEEIERTQCQDRKVDHTSGLGLANVVARLQSYFGSKFSYAIWSEPHRGTRVTLRIRPLTEKALFKT